ncbi:MAG: hypothetical protein E7292_10970 [Lachnospiraceae bacterium]|nr:hypothetical protein [Lachnospiraceae bacterium]
MKIKAFKRVLSLALATAMVLTACGQKPAANTSETTKASESAPAKESEAAPSEEKKEEVKEPVAVTLYPKDANLFSGEVTGYRGEALAAHGIKLEVWAYSDEKTTAMMTSGDFPDMMYVTPSTQPDIFETLVATDKIIDYSDYAEYLPHVLGDEVVNEYITSNIDHIRENWSAGTGGLYVLPFGVGVNSGVYAQQGTFDRNTPKLKWDVYEAIGAPEVTDMWSLIDIAEKMLEYQPTLEDGTKMFGTFLDNGDSKYFNSLTLWMTWKGSNVSGTQYMAEYFHKDGAVEYILEDDSVFKEGLKWYNELYKRGLVDPDSISTSRADQAPKLDNGFAMIPGGSLPGWATKYYEVFPSDATLYRSFTSATYTGGSSIVIFKDSENIETCLELVDMMADPYEWMKVYYGPEGCMWNEDDGVLSITDEFAAWLKEKGSINFFPMPDGTEYSIFNTSVLFANGTPLADHVDINGDPVPYIPTSWPDAQAITGDNDNWNAWKETMGAEDLWDYTEQHGIEVIQDSKFDGVAFPTADDNQLLTIAALKDVVVPACWKMVYAEDEAEFEAIWDAMVKDAETMGAKDIFEWFKANFVPNK